jgi:hypothetical protein
MNWGNKSWITTNYGISLRFSSLHVRLSVLHSNIFSCNYNLPPMFCRKMSEVSGGRVSASCVHDPHCLENMTLMGQGIFWRRFHFAVIQYSALFFIQRQRHHESLLLELGLLAFPLHGADPSFVGPEAYTIFGYEGEYLFRVPPRAFEGARASEGPWSLGIFSFMGSPPLGDRSEHRFERDGLGRLLASHLHIRKWNHCWVWDGCHI